MNYIGQLQKKVEAKDAEIAALRNGINDLRAYLMSPKFFEDTSVNKNDVLLRLSETINAANDIAI